MRKSPSQARAALRAASARSSTVDAARRLTTIYRGDRHGSSGSIAGPRGQIETREGPLCRRLRRRAQRRAQVDRPRAARRLRQSCLGRDGRPGRHRFPRHPLQVADPVGRTRAASSSFRAKAAIWSASTSNSTSSTPDERVADRNITSDDLIAAARRILHPLHARGEGGRLVVGLRDRPAAGRQVRRRARGGDRDAPAPRLHRRRRLPHPQPEGGPGHERLDAGRLQSRLEARRRAARAQPRRSCCTPTRRNARRSRRS